MSTLTVFGDAGGPGTLSEERTRSGRFMGGHTYRELSLGLPESGCPVDLDHNAELTIGEVIYAELGDNDRLRCVAVVHDLALDQVEENVYYSPLLEMVGPGIDQRSTYIARQAELLGLALTFSTARIGASPVQWLKGDLRSGVTRGGWPGSWDYHYPLLKRALDSLRGPRIETRSATHIADLRPRDSGILFGFKEGDRIPADQRGSRELPGGLLRSGHSGRVLRVR